MNMYDTSLLYSRHETCCLFVECLFKSVQMCQNLSSELENKNNMMGKKRVLLLLVIFIFSVYTQYNATTVLPGGSDKVVSL